MHQLILLILIIIAFGSCSQGQMILDNLVAKQDSVRFKNFISRWDIHFNDNWVFESANIQEIDHFENGYVLEWTKEDNGIKHLRGYVFDLNSKFIRAYEQRFVNDTLLSQGEVHLEDRQVEYIAQVIINKSSLKKEGVYWDYDVDGYHFEIYQNGVLSCIYKTINLNHYYMLFEDENQNDIELVSGLDCLEKN